MSSEPTDAQFVVPSDEELAGMSPEGLLAIGSWLAEEARTKGGSLLRPEADRVLRHLDGTTYQEAARRQRLVLQAALGDVQEMGPLLEGLSADELWKCFGEASDLGTSGSRWSRAASWIVRTGGPGCEVLLAEGAEVPQGTAHALSALRRRVEGLDLPPRARARLRTTNAEPTALEVQRIAIDVACAGTSFARELAAARKRGQPLAPALAGALEDHVALAARLGERGRLEYGIEAYVHLVDQLRDPLVAPVLEAMGHDRRSRIESKMLSQLGSRYLLSLIHNAAPGAPPQHPYTRADVLGMFGDLVRSLCDRTDASTAWLANDVLDATECWLSYGGADQSEGEHWAHEVERLESIARGLDAGAFLDRKAQRCLADFHRRAQRGELESHDEMVEAYRKVEDVAEESLLRADVRPALRLLEGLPPLRELQELRERWVAEDDGIDVEGLDRLIAYVSEAAPRLERRIAALDDHEARSARELDASLRGEELAEHGRDWYDERQTDQMVLLRLEAQARSAHPEVFALIDQGRPVDAAMEALQLAPHVATRSAPLAVGLLHGVERALEARGELGGVPDELQTKSRWTALLACEGMVERGEDPGQARWLSRFANDWLVRMARRAPVEQLGQWMEWVARSDAVVATWAQDGVGKSFDSMHDLMARRISDLRGGGDADPAHEAVLDWYDDHLRWVDAATYSARVEADLRASVDRGATGLETTIEHLVRRAQRTFRCAEGIAVGPGLLDAVATTGPPSAEALAALLEDVAWTEQLVVATVPSLASDELASLRALTASIEAATKEVQGLPMEADVAMRDAVRAVASTSRAASWGAEPEALWARMLLDRGSLAAEVPEPLAPSGLGRLLPGIGRRRSHGVVPGKGNGAEPAPQADSQHQPEQRPGPSPRRWRSGGGSWRGL